MKENGGPAFPKNDATVNRISNLDGLTLRDYFAGQALISLIAIDNGQNETLIVHLSYCYADEMLKQRAL